MISEKYSQSTHKELTVLHPMDSYCKQYMQIIVKGFQTENIFSI